MTRPAHSVRVLLVIAGLAAAVASPAQPEPKTPGCSIRQITSTTRMQENGWAVISGDGKRIVFYSSVDPASGTELRSYDYYLYDLTTESLVRITEDAVRANLPRRPAIDREGTRIALSANGEPVPGDNPDGNYEIFLFDTKIGLSQLTHTTSLSNGSPTIDLSGTRIAFSSDADLVPGGNGDGKGEIFLFDMATRGFQQLTRTERPSNQPTISGDGRYVVFLSSADLDPTLNLDGSTEVFLADLEAGSFLQLTDSRGGWMGAPAISADGARIFFQSTAGLVAGLPNDGLPSLFLADVKRGTLFDLGHSQGGHPPSVDGDGERMVYAQAEVYLAEVLPENGAVRLEATPLADSRGAAACPACQPSLSADGTRVAFVSATDLDHGKNPDGNYEIFLATCSPHEGKVCVADDSTLCLLGDRFRVTAGWESRRGASGPGSARQITNSSGYFWFFDEESVEVVVRVVDRCARSGRFTVFVAGMTRLKTEVTVEDTKTGVTVTYRRPLDQLYLPVADGRTFAACP